MINHKKKIRMRAFTLVELLTTLAIMGILVALLIPALSMVQKTARTVKQKAQFHTIELGPKTEGLVQPGQVVGVIESMKLMNDVRAEVGGVVIAVLAEEGMPVEYGQSLFRLMPAAEQTGKETR